MRIFVAHCGLCIVHLFRRGKRCKCDDKHVKLVRTSYFSTRLAFFHTETVVKNERGEYFGVRLRTDNFYTQLFLCACVHWPFALVCAARDCVCVCVCMTA